MNLAMDLIREALLGGSGGGGGGGDSSFTLLKTEDLGTITSSSSSATDIGKTITVDNAYDYDLLIIISTSDSSATGAHLQTICPIGLQYNGALTPPYTIGTIGTNRNIKIATPQNKVAFSTYGVYFTATNSKTTVTLTGKVKYSSGDTGTINGTYVAKVYGLKLPE